MEKLCRRVRRNVDLVSSMFLPMQFFTGNGTKQLDTPTRLVSGALAGITSVCELNLVSGLEVCSLNIAINDYRTAEQVRHTH